MEINDEKFSEFWGEFREFRGQVHSDMKNMGEHISAVSKKADRVREELNGHIQDDNAHGSGGAHRAFGNILKALGWLTAAGSFAYALAKR